MLMEIHVPCLSPANIAARSWLLCFGVEFKACVFLQALQKEAQELKNRKNKHEWTDAQPLTSPSPSESVSWRRSKINLMQKTVR